MLQPTIYIPSRLTRWLAPFELASGSQQEPYCIGRVCLAPISSNLNPIRAVA